VVPANNPTGNFALESNTNRQKEEGFNICDNVVFAGQISFEFCLKISACSFFFCKFRELFLRTYVLNLQGKLICRTCICIGIDSIFSINVVVNDFQANFDFYVIYFIWGSRSARIKEYWTVFYI
jgi:hypothetical protein